MSIECDFYNNEFKFEEYDFIVNKYVNEKCLKIKSEEKISRIFDDFIKRIKFDFQIDTEEYKFAEESIKKIIAFKPGRALVKRLIKSNKGLFISHSNTETAKFTRETSTITINKDVDYYYVIDVNGEKKFQKTTAACVLAHELIHALHYLAIGLISSKVPLAVALPDRSSSSTMALAMLSSFRAAMLRSGFASLSGTLDEIKPIAHYFEDPLKLNRLVVDVNLVDDFGAPLDVAIEKRNLSLIRQLIERGARPECSHLKQSSISKLLKSFNSENSQELNHALITLLKEVPWGDALHRGCFKEID